ncbi:MAG: replicative DNA helicase [Acidimicrobiia bacterium]|nr:replicative DNA helicase [Acidimicrobiia bacterium]
MDRRTDRRSGRGDEPRRTTNRVPPHNIEAEESVLGAVLLSRDAISAVSELNLRPDDFYKPGHQYIFDAARALYATGRPVDTITVADELRRIGLLEQIGGSEALHALQNATPAISNAAHYAGIVQSTAVLRQLIHVASDIAELAYEGPDDARKAVDEAESKVFRIADERTAATERPLGELLKLAMERLEETYERGDTITGIATGYHELDDLLSGLQPSTLNIVGARPAMGKTAFGLGIATHVAQTTSRPVLVFSMEMGHAELTQRILASEARVNSTKLRTGRLNEADWAKIGRAIGRLEVPLYLDDNPRITVMEIRAKARRLKHKHGGLALIVIDYLQLMTGGPNPENRQLEISEISRNLKILARELEVPILALSQLSRNLESRAEKRPMLQDLRESGALEQDADVVMFLYRDEVYNPESPDRGSAEVIVAKHRSGPIGIKRLVFLGDYTRFDNAARGV